jgi:hypothetical protein
MTSTRVYIYIYIYIQKIIKKFRAPGRTLYRLKVINISVNIDSTTRSALHVHLAEEVRTCATLAGEIRTCAPQAFHHHDQQRPETSDGQ